MHAKKYCITHKGAYTHTVQTTYYMYVVYLFAQVREVFLQPPFHSILSEKKKVSLSGLLLQMSFPFSLPLPSNCGSNCCRCSTVVVVAYLSVLADRVISDLSLSQHLCTDVSVDSIKHGVGGGREAKES